MFKNKFCQVLETEKKVLRFLCLLFLFVFMASSWAWAQGYAPSGRIPKITIGGQQVLTNEQLKHRAVDDDLPMALRNDRMRMAIENRRRIQIWNHTPMRGPEEAPITILEINDLSCLYCQDLSKEIDRVFALPENKEKIQHYVMHLPVDKYNLTNSAAFYGRLAFDAGGFWAYRNKLYEVTSDTDDLFINKLLAVGVEEREIRRMTRKNARRYYRELDADMKASKGLGEVRPPILYVNGIKIGGSITLNELEPLLEYEKKLYEKTR